MFIIPEIPTIEDSFRIDAKAVDDGIPPSFWVTYSALANTAGGVVLLGAVDNRESGKFTARGIRNPGKIIQALWSGLNDRKQVSANILFRDHIYSQEYEGKEIVVVEIPRAHPRVRPVFVGQDMFSGAYRRMGRTDRRCSRDEIQAMLREQEEKSADTRLLWRRSMEDLDRETIDRYRLVFDNIRPEHPYCRMGKDEFLVRTGSAGRGEDGRLHPTLAGLLFFGKNIPLCIELPGLVLDYREILPSGTGWASRISSREGGWSGNLFDFYCRVIDRLTTDLNLPMRTARTAGSYRLGRETGAGSDALTRRIRACLSEAFVNALTHADFFGEGGIIIDKGALFISIANPGSFLVDPVLAGAGGVSYTRNENVSRLFSLIRAGSLPGEGVCEIHRTWRESGLKTPQLLENFERNRVTLILAFEKED